MVGIFRNDIVQGRDGCFGGSVKFEAIEDDEDDSSDSFDFQAGESVADKTFIVLRDVRPDASRVLSRALFMMSGLLRVL